MMKFAPAALLLVAGFAGDAPAQLRPGMAGAGSYYPGGYGTRPTTSPYLNLVGRGGNPAVNYYGIVRPQMQLQAAVFGGVGPTGGVSPYEDPTAPDLFRATGHFVAFNNLMYFYNSNPAGPNMGTGGWGGNRAAGFNNTTIGAGAGNMQDGFGGGYGGFGGSRGAGFGGYGGVGYGGGFGGGFGGYGGFGGSGGYRRGY